MSGRYTEGDVIETAAWATVAGFLVGCLVTAYVAWAWVTS